MCRECASPLEAIRKTLTPCFPLSLAKGEGEENESGGHPFGYAQGRPQTPARGGLTPSGLPQESIGEQLLEVARRARPEGERQPTGKLPGIWGAWERLPLHRPERIVSLGEGNTPCVPLTRLGRRLGLKSLWAKLEYLNPTGSFKDRGTTVLISMARELGYRKLVEDSSGNAGASVAAYAARAGLEATVFAPATAPVGKRRQITFYGARLRLVKGDRHAVAVAARAFVDKTGAFYASHNWSPYFLEGMKSFAYELAHQLAGPVRHILFPVGNGSLLLGCWKGLQELQAQGKVTVMPRLHAVQAEGCMPVVAALRGEPWDISHQRPTVAGGIAVNRPPRGEQVVETVRATGGTGVAVKDKAIVAWQRLLAQEEGIFAEPTSAAAFAGLEALVRHGVIGPADLVVVPVTGFGLKDKVPPA